MSRKAKVAVIGAGWWSTTAHIPTLIAHPEASLVALADIRPDVLAKAARQYGVEKSYTDYREMLAREELDGVVVAVWHAAHYEVARACLEHDLHVVLEKPMTLEAVHARHLTELARQRNRELIIGYPWHYSAHALHIREVIRSGVLGEIHFISNTFASYVLAFYRGDDRAYQPVFNYPVVGPGDVYSDPIRSGGGQGHLQVTHSAALMLFLTGLKPASVLALMNNLDVQVDVVDAMIVRMENGALASMGSTGALPAGDPEQLVIQIYGDRGWLQANFTEGTCVIHHPNRVEERLPAPEHADQIYPAHAPAINLVEIILGKAANGSPPEIGWRTVELLDAAYRSAANGGQAVPVDSLYGA